MVAKTLETLNNANFLFLYLALLDKSNGIRTMLGSQLQLLGIESKGSGKSRPANELHTLS
ncbi:hypothetical protein PCCS19_02700 [Paenibacillus sp. CCS19]|nr:hypothetical protein PCCS19_02700 [Paenibacillus cellulosilyticus]